MSNDNKAFRLFIKTLLLLIFFHIFFILGIVFQKWGGLDRVLPLTINYLREHVLGDDFVLYLEKRFFKINDSLGRLFQTKDENKNIINESIDKPINVNLKQLIEAYRADNKVLDNTDYKYLSLLTKGFTPDLTSAYSTPVKGEGVWEKFDISFDTFKPYYAKTFVRTDPERKNSFVVLYKFDLDRLKLDFVAGKDDVKNGHLTGTMNEEQKQKVKWIFSGGYQYRHGKFGMKYNGITLLPPRIGAMTVFFYKDGSIKIAEWTKDTTDDSNIISYRQNEKLFIVNGQIDPDIDKKVWGSTPKDWDPVYTVRTGMGLTANNELIFAFGPNLSAKNLALGMVQAGVVNGMHLDMNYLNTHLVRIERSSNGKLKSINEHKVLSAYDDIFIKSHPRDYFLLLER